MPKNYIHIYVNVNICMYSTYLYKRTYVYLHSYQAASRLKVKTTISCCCLSCCCCSFCSIKSNQANRNLHCCSRDEFVKFTMTIAYAKQINNKKKKKIKCDSKDDEASCDETQYN